VAKFKRDLKEKSSEARKKDKKDKTLLCISISEIWEPGLMNNRSDFFP
jgi:hypothetical protein